MNTPTTHDEIRVNINNPNPLTQSDMDGFTLTETYFRHGLNRRLRYTEGVQYFADNARAYWFIDLVALGRGASIGPVELLRINAEPFGVIDLKIKEGQATVTMSDDIPGEILYHTAVPYVESPEGEWQFYLTNDGKGLLTLSLPGEC